MREKVRIIAGSHMKKKTQICDFCARNPATYGRVRCGCCGQNYQAWYCHECQQNVEAQAYCVGNEAVFSDLIMGRD